MSLILGKNILLAGTLGYAGIALFVGAIAARYSFIENRRPLVQLLLNTGIAVLFTGVFYALFLIVMIV